MPAFTRWRASAHARSGSPTITKTGVPMLLTWASTSTRRGSRPTRAWVTARASTTSTLWTQGSRVPHSFRKRDAQTPHRMVTPAPLVYRNDHIVQGNEVGRGEIMLLTANGL